ncbi:MAG: kelch repeat-containing protein [Nitrospira sp.]|nr:kelch repeat-containing protein [Nitrospira sp.]
MLIFDVWLVSRASRHWVVITVILFTFVHWAIARGSIQASGHWETLAPATIKRTEVAAAAVGDKIYLVGGFRDLDWMETILSRFFNRPGILSTDAVEEYDTTLDRWRLRAPLPIPVHHASAASVANQLYVVGGLIQWPPGRSARVFAYDPTTNSWSERAPMPTPRGALGLAELNGKLYAIGGIGANGNSAAVEMYDPVADTWMARAALPTPRDHLAVTVSHQKLYAIGGRLGGDFNRNVTSVEAYDPITDRWETVAHLPTPRSGIGAGTIDGIIYTVGGESSETTFNLNHAYLPATNKWERRAPLPTSRHGLGVVSLHGRLYVLSGGPSPGATYTNVNEVFIPA